MITEGHFLRFESTDSMFGSAGEDVCIFEKVWAQYIFTVNILMVSEIELKLFRFVLSLDF